ncbi:hypothetical protein VOLCADRAFT_97438 [Volvox carteri f. nagariensis]|uniref:Uncharacterized protein n=1 Tax=Volvox carteri f. nagariensis TaxID=3068 RepID=D8UCR9_VOLCA|nr:uncharacterized protein VOLCADRAFT_97438 [Volvox carteri f. nagariensis]EFJ42437.1 hypothetical protein VOLCADRAFT_97438 [Volvox carteri f. nagariensis]|eukprot:XP_002956500.1 hypothetical protein VOLCADRAFT_97438 [Volvox carteri f. nagariensis]
MAVMSRPSNTWTAAGFYSSRSHRQNRPTSSYETRTVVSAAARVSQHFVKRNAGKSLKVGARALKKTHRHFVSAGSVMQAMYRMLHLGTPHKITQKQFDEAALQTGCKGLTAFAALPYVDLSCLFTVSTGHALLFGVFLVVTSDFGRRYKCIMQYRKSYRMEDWLHFVETFSRYIFKGDVLPEALRALCWSLCSTVTHYFWPRPPDETREQFLVAAKAAACKLRAYTTRLEELEVPGYMFTVNLHICVCRLYDQECQLGSAAGFSDLPVERMMQQMKTQGGRMVSQAPEKHYAQWLCLMWASESLTEADPATGAKHTTNQQLERMLARRAVNTEAAWFDKPGANGYLLGRGHMVYPSPERVAQVRAAMASLVHWYALAFEDVASWTLGPSASYELDTDRLDRVLMSTPPDCPKARSFLRAEALDEEQYFRAEYGRQQQRTSCWACYQAEVGNETRTYAAYLKYFVHLPAEDGAQDVRFTVADVYSGQVFSGGLVVVNMAAAQTVRAGSQWEMWQDLGLPLSELKGNKSYRMEDWLHFVETFSRYIFKGDVLPEALRALCWSLCSTVTHYFWPRPPDETREQFLVAAKAAACKLRAYTTRLEELEVPGYMFTVNLHICVCRLYDQECQLGSAAGFSDLPVERMMQQMKTQGGRMVSQAPEKHYAQWLCLMWASESLTEADPATGAKHTTNQQLERMLARRAVNTEAAWFDKPGANGYLLGRGHMVYPSPERVAQVRAAMASLVHWYALAFEDVASWTLGPSASYELDTDRLDRVLMSTPPDCPKARSFLRAEALDEEQYFRAEYGRQQQRTSCWACYQAEVGNETRTYAAYLKYFVHLPAEDGAQDVRFTVADVYSGQVFSGGLVVVNMAAAQTVRAGSQWEMWQDLGLPLSHLICRLKASLCMALYKTGGPFQKKVLDKILRPSTITADHGAVAAAVGAEAVDTAANDGDALPNGSIPSPSPSPSPSPRPKPKPKPKP